MTASAPADTGPVGAEPADSAATGLTDRRAARGGIALVAASQYLVAEQVVAGAWVQAQYSFGDNYISDLGVPECTVLTDRVVCSPQFLIMDAAFVLQGLIVLLAVWQLSWLLPRGWRLASRVLGVLHAVGLIMVGVFPGSIAEELGGDPTRMLLHSIGAALAIVGGNLFVLATGIGALRRWRGYGILSIVLGLIGTAAVAISPVTDLGLGVGGIERVAVYPIVGWLILTGVSLVVAHRGALRQEQFDRMQAEDAAAVAASAAARARAGAGRGGGAARGGGAGAAPAAGAARAPAAGADTIADDLGATRGDARPTGGDS